jgi:hypothetical protein
LSDDHVRELDRAVFDAFDLPPASVRRIAAELAGQRAPEGKIRFAAIGQPADNVATPSVLRAGATIDVRESGVKVDIPGLTESGGVWIETPLRLPGWLARPSRTFDVLVSDQDLRQATYRFQGDSWMSLNELLAEFA